MKKEELSNTSLYIGNKTLWFWWGLTRIYFLHMLLGNSCCTPLFLTYLHRIPAGIFTQFCLACMDVSFVKTRRESEMWLFVKYNFFSPASSLRRTIVNRISILAFALIMFFFFVWSRSNVQSYVWEKDCCKTGFCWTSFESKWFKILSTLIDEPELDTFSLMRESWKSLRQMKC